jgi:hypothetical protein
MSPSSLGEEVSEGSTDRMEGQDATAATRETTNPNSLLPDSSVVSLAIIL